MLFAHSTSPLPRFLASQDTGHHQTCRAYAPLNGESSLPSLMAIGGLCIDVSLGTSGPDPVLYQLFATLNRSFPIRKKSSRNGSGCHVLGKTSRSRPPTTLKLGREDPQLSRAYALEVWWRSVSCEARNHGSGEVLCAKKHVFSCVDSEQK